MIPDEIEKNKKKYDSVSTNKVVSLLIIKKEYDMKRIARDKLRKDD